ncbi:taste receptor type 2 member 40 [Anguilla rostrata]|uniref:taste receptor type 2 member 40 n=1 Tax=Anguilla rostrata TaxID=7938 RepID=UPI0030D48178
MSLGAHVAQMCALFFLVVITVLWNICNLAVNVLHQWKSRGSHQPVGLIISCISISNVFLELSMSAILFLFWADLLFSVNCLPFLRTTAFIWLQSICVSFWSIAWLSTFYCVKIVSTSSALLCKLKNNISFFITTALLLTVLFSFVACLPTLFFQLPSSNGTTANGTRNATNLRLVLPAWIDGTLYLYVLMGFLCPVPVLVMLPTSLRLVAHLCHHTLRMKKNENQVQGTDSYLMVCRMTVSMVGVYLTMVVIFLIFLARWTPGKFPFELFAWNLSFFCLAMGILLTLLNKQTKEKLMSVCCCCCWVNV